MTIYRPSNYMARIKVGRLTRSRVSNSPAGTLCQVRNVPRISNRMQDVIGGQTDVVVADQELAKCILTKGLIAKPLASSEIVGALLNDEHQRWRDAAREIGLLPE